MSVTSPIQDQTPAAWTEAEISAYSRERIELGSKSFAGASKLFDPATRASAMMLYAWCRHCDDVIDGQELGHNTTEAPHAATEARLSELRAKTIAALDGRASEPAFLALQTVAARHVIPRRFPLDLIEGMAMDVRGHQARTLDDTLLYCYHVAGCVGVMMAIVMGAKTHAALDRASDLGLAFQLTNIARDVAADARAGRLYIPAAWLAEAGISPDQILAPQNRDAVHAVRLRLLGEADRYYASAYYGLPMLPARSALAIAAARRIYQGIGANVRALGPAGLETRAFVSRARKRVLAAAALADTARSHGLSRFYTQPDRSGLWTMPHPVGGGP